jgi:hypothetical protein
MARLTKRLMKRFAGDPKGEGYRRSLRGLREGDSRELSLGLALIALAYLRSSGPRKRLIYRKTVPTGSALVIHHKRRGDPKLKVRKG